MSLGTFTIAEQGAAQGPLFHDRCTVQGDDAYPSGGTPGFEAAYQAALAAVGIGPREIVAVIPQHDTTINVAEYDHANDKLFVRVKATGVESAVSDQSGNVYAMLIISK